MKTQNEEVTHVVNFIESLSKKWSLTNVTGLTHDDIKSELLYHYAVFYNRVQDKPPLERVKLSKWYVRRKLEHLFRFYQTKKRNTRNKRVELYEDIAYKTIDFLKQDLSYIFNVERLSNTAKAVWDILVEDDSLYGKRVFTGKVGKKLGISKYKVKTALNEIAKVLIRNL